MTLIEPDAAIRVAGDWTHRDIYAHGARFHVVEQGEGPAVVLLHGFPTFWWTWRHQITALAEAGYRAIAMDLRGYGGSDHPPHGYDPFTLSADVAAVIRSLGESEAVIVGHGWGAFVAWSMAVLEPDVVTAIVPVSSPHPRRVRSASMQPWRRRISLGYAAGFQVPFLPERALTRDEGARVGDLITEWSGTPGWPDTEALSMYRSAFMRWPTAHTAIEFHRWAGRSVPRPDGLRYMSRMKADINADVLHVHGSRDPMMSIDACEGSASFVRGSYALSAMDTGHFPHEENPRQFNELLITWLNGE